ncbi:MAG: hypothetical protein K0U41_00610 [Gammaproteobacteria bacterium]|nr:hypothetical protein [Gammaproteobacteria bacterium]
METKLKSETAPAKEVNKSSPVVGTNSKAPNGANGTAGSYTSPKLLYGRLPGMRIAKIRNR